MTVWGLELWEFALGVCFLFGLVMWVYRKVGQEKVDETHPVHREQHPSIIMARLRQPGDDQFN